MQSIDYEHQFPMLLPNESGDLAELSSFILFFQFAKLYFCCLCLVSMVSILYVVLHCRGYLKFNLNIKVLFYIQFSSCFVHAAILGTFQVHHLIVAIFADHPSDLILTPALYKYAYIPFMFALAVTFSSQLVMVAEKTLASYYFEYYEAKSRTIGIISISLTFLVPILVCILFFATVTFNYPVISILTTPPTAAFRINLTLGICVIIYFFTVFHSIKLYRFNQRKNGLSRSQSYLGLASKYQMSQNLTSTRILWQLTFAQTSIYLIYGVALLLIRMFVPWPKPPMWIVINELFYTPPIYCAVMPILCIYTIRKSQNERNKRISSIVSIRSTGAEGWDNYQKMLKDQWA